jgi:hypothetical protein
LTQTTYLAFQTAKDTLRSTIGLKAFFTIHGGKKSIRGAITIYS